MGKLSKAQEAAQRRAYMAELRKKELAEKKKQNRLLWLISIIASVAVIAAVALTLIFTLPKDTARVAPKMEELDFSEISENKFIVSADPTEYVRIAVSYTDENGEQKSGNIIVRLFADVAPETVQNFQDLVGANYYAGSSFHRVYEGFMIQGGKSGTGAATPAIKGEFSSNGFENNLLHKRGVISMARTDEPDSASDQFFIMHQDNTSLDGNYAAFGYVVCGMEHVDGIAKTEVEPNIAMNNEMSAPVNKVSINVMTFVTLR